MYAERIIEAESPEEAKEIYEVDGSTYDIRGYDFYFGIEACAEDAEFSNG